MGYVEKTFITFDEAPPKTLTTRLRAIWADEHRHAELTAGLLILAALITGKAGLVIAPAACVVFAVILLLGDLFSRRDKQH